MRNLFIAVLVLCGAGAPCLADTVSFFVTVNTTPLQNSPSAGPFYVDFQLVTNTGGSTATLDQFNFGSGAAVAGTTAGYGTTLGDITNGSITLDGSVGGGVDNELWQQFTPGSSLSFQVTLNGTFSDTAPDAFHFSMLTSDLYNIPTTDPAVAISLPSFVTATLTTTPTITTYTGDPTVTSYSDGHPITAISSPIAPPSISAVPLPKPFFAGAVLLFGVAVYRRMTAVRD